MLTLKDYNSEDDFEYILRLTRSEIGTQQPVEEMNFTKRDIRSRLRKNKTLMIYVKEKRVGFLSFRVNSAIPFLPVSRSKRVFVDLIALEPSAQHRGIGLAAVQELETYSANKGFHSMYGHVFHSNTHALNAWKKFGAEIIAKRPQYLILQKKLSPNLKKT